MCLCTRCSYTVCAPGRQVDRDHFIISILGPTHMFWACCSFRALCRPLPRFRLLHGRDFDGLCMSSVWVCVLIVCLRFGRFLYLCSYLCHGHVMAYCSACVFTSGPLVGYVGIDILVVLRMAIYIGWDLDCLHSHGTSIH